MTTSTNAPDTFYEEEKVHTGYDPNDRRNMQTLQSWEQRKPVEVPDSKIITPKGREIDKTDPLRSLAPDVWEKLEQAEMERAQRAEKRAKGIRTGQLLSDALKSLVDVYGEAKGKHNTPRNPEQLKSLEGYDADHAERLRRIYKEKMDDDLAAARQAGIDQDRAARQKAKEKDQELQANKFDFEKYKFPKTQKDKADEAEKNRKSREKIAGMRKPAAKNEEKKEEEVTYNYSVPLKYRQSPNYQRLNPDSEGSVQIKGVHVARYANDFTNQYPQKMAELKQKRLSIDPNDPAYMDKAGAIKQEEARLTYINGIAKQLATGGGKWNEADVTTVLDEMMRPDTHMEIINQEPIRIQAEPLPQAVNPVTQYIQNVFGGKAITPQTPQTPVTPQTPQTQQPQGNSQERVTGQTQAPKFSTPELNLKPGDPKRTQAVMKLKEVDYVDLYGDKPKMQDKLMISLGDVTKDYIRDYPLTNTSPLANKAREKVVRKTRDELIRYWANLGDGTIEKLEYVAKEKTTTIEELVEPLAKSIAEGTVNINDIF